MVERWDGVYVVRVRINELNSRGGKLVVKVYVMIGGISRYMTSCVSEGENMEEQVGVVGS